mmetsp:Transcript_21686/g.50594  ORF Transcript_21686/g.50594 Transcript_21686/m.50594 type:complete len:160 (-) Transcript_21686:220-699(-)
MKVSSSLRRRKSSWRIAVCTDQSCNNREWSGKDHPQASERGREEILPPAGQPRPCGRSCSLRCIKEFHPGGKHFTPSWRSPRARCMPDCDQALEGLKFAVFGAGNSQYEHYNWMGKMTDRLLEHLGAQRVQKLGLGDSSKDHWIRMRPVPISTGVFLAR